MKIIYSFVAEAPGRFEVSEGHDVLKRVWWNQGDLVLVLECGDRVVVPCA